MQIFNGLRIMSHVLGAYEMELRQDTKRLFPLQGEYQVVLIETIWSCDSSEYIKEEEILYSSDDYSDANAVFETTISLQNLEQTALNKWFHNPQR